MEAEERRAQIVKLLREAKEPVTGTVFAKILKVSRQIIVQDIALLRASGIDIMATPQGYMIIKTPAGSRVKKTFACVHGYDKLETELLAIVDCGGRVLDVIVEHPLYGELRGMLNLKSRYDVQNFVAQLAGSQAQPLSVLTGGVHLHTVEADTEQIMATIERKLAEAGVLLS